MNDDDIKKAFVKEMAFLKNRMMQYQKDYPETFDMLMSQSDPMFSRLLEGFAFLTSKLQLQLDQGLPGITEAVLKALWPSALEDVPSKCVIEASEVVDIVKIDRHSVFETPDDGQVSLKFSAMRETILYPLKIQDVTVNKNTLTIAFQKTAEFSLPSMRYIDFYIDCVNVEAWQYIQCLSSVAKIELTADQYTRVLPNTCIHSLLPEFENGLALLKAFFNFKEQFLFFRMQEAFQQLPNVSDFFVTFQFKCGVDFKLLLKAAIKINCIPVQNAYVFRCDPILAEQDRVTYPLKHSDHDQKIILNCLSVVAFSAQSNTTTQYNRQGQSIDGHAENTYDFYHENNMPMIAVSLHKPIEPNMSFHCDAWACDGALAKKVLVGSDTLVLKNALCVTTILQPLTQFRKQLISSQQLQYIMMLIQADWQYFRELKHLQQVIKLFHPHSQFDSMRMAECVQAVSGQVVATVQQGMHQLGFHWQITLDPYGALSLGELQLFAIIIQKFLCYYRPVNWVFTFEFINSVDRQVICHM